MTKKKKDQVTRQGRKYVGIFFEHLQFQGREIYCAAGMPIQLRRVIQKIFSILPAAAQAQAPPVKGEPRNNIGAEVLQVGNNREDIASV